MCQFFLTVNFSYSFIKMSSSCISNHVLSILENDKVIEKGVQLLW